MRKTWVIIICIVMLLGCTPEQHHQMDFIQDQRRAAGVQELLPSIHLNADAQAYAEHLAATGILRHSTNMVGTLPPGWRLVGENVGMGPSMDAINAAWMLSPGHRANMLNPRYQWMGTGVAVDANGTVWSVQRYAAY